VSLLAVQQHIQTLLDGLTTPQLLAQGVAPAHAFVAPPAVVTDTMTAPEIYVWDGRASNRRQTAPRNTLGAANWTQPNPALPVLPISSAGFRAITWHVSVWVMFLLGAEENAITYPLLVDTVMKQLSLDLMPVALTDPQTGDVSQLTHIGEEIELEYPTPQETADERIFLYTLLLTVQVQEKVQI
jgi:hypothetical protein